MATAESKVEDKSAPGPRGTRGPSYPAIDLGAAAERAKQFWAYEKRSAAPLAAAANHWGYSEASSSTRVLVAALLAYGLMEDSGSRGARMVKLSERGLDIVLDEQPGFPVRTKALREAVRAPKINQEIFGKWPPNELPSDPTLRYFLLRTKGFNESAVDGYIETLRASIKFASLDDQSHNSVGESESQQPRSANAEPEIGDLVQWESGGVLRLEAPRRVRAKQEHEGSWWVFVEGSETGIPMEETSVVERGTEQRPSAIRTPPVLPVQPSAADPQPVAAVQDEREWMRGTLSKDRAVNYRLIVSGDLGSREIGKLIKLLEAQKLVLDEDDEEDLA